MNDGHRTTHRVQIGLRKGYGTLHCHQSRNLYDNKVRGAYRVLGTSEVDTRLLRLVDRVTMRLLYVSKESDMTCYALHVYASALSNLSYHLWVTDVIGNVGSARSVSAILYHRFGGTSRRVVKVILMTRRILATRGRLGQHLHVNLGHT